MSRVGSVFNEEANAELARMRTILSSLANPLIGLGVERDSALLDVERLAVRIGSGESLGRNAVIAFLKDLGNDLTGSMNRLHAALEDHFVRFFDYMKKRSDEELSLWMPKPGAVTPATAGMLRNAPPAQSRVKAPTAALASAVESLNTWLAVELEAVMTATHATKGAVYLRSTDSSGYLRRAFSLPAQSDLPQDVALASGSTIGTVVQTSIGANITRSRLDAFAEAAELTGKPAMTSAVVFNVNTAIVLPLTIPSSTTPLGCVVIANKVEPGQPTFTTADEHHVWAFVASAEGVFMRYPHMHLLNYTIQRDVFAGLKSAAQIAPVTEVSEVEPLRVYGSVVPTKAPKMVIMRQNTAAASLSAKALHMDNAANTTSGNAASSAANIVMNSSNAGGALGTSSSPPSPSGPTSPVAAVSVAVNDEDVLESVAPYIRNLEMLWHKSLETVMSLRTECAKWEGKVTQKEGHIVDLEVAMKNLAKQLHRTKADIRKIQRAVPQHLRETLSDDWANDSMALVASQQAKPGSSQQQQRKATLTIASNSDAAASSTSKKPAAILPSIGPASARVPSSQGPTSSASSAIVAPKTPRK